MADYRKKTSAYLDYSDFRKIKTPEEASGCFILFGDENYIKESCLSQLKNLALNGGDETFNYRRLNGPNIDLDELLEAVEAFPSFAERTFVEVRDFDIYKCKEEAAEKLMAILTDVPEYCCLVFIYATIPFSEDKRRKKLHEAVKKSAKLFEINMQEQNMLIKWIQRRFAAANQTISTDNCEYLILLCGGLMTGLISEIEKISAYAKQKEISRSDIDAVAVPVAEAQVFKLSNAIAENNFDEAARLMGTLLQMNEHPVMILGLIGSQCRKLYIARLMRDKGGSVTQLMKTLDFRSEYPAKLLMNNASKFSLSWCEKAVLACAETDYQMKNSPIDEEELLRSLFLRLAGER
ncbi:MAG: DNA polymerase III subunit delta [Clostridiales bacterium]|nr:DNA polymerase III subunit delta [Clostridiales bacterium]